MRKGNVLLITFILLTALSFIVGSLLYLTSIGTKNVGYLARREKAFYIADAGLQKAAWYINTSVANGGRGLTWRTTGTSESFAGGSYIMRVTDEVATGYILITSEGTYQNFSRTLQLSYQKTLSTCAYAVFSMSESTFSIYTSDIYGNVFANSNVNILDGGWVYPGYTVSLSSGHSLYVGSGSHGDLGSTPSSIPVFPTLGTSYLARIATARASADSYRYLRGVNLNGGTINSSGDIDIDAPITGPGTICAAGNIYIYEDYSGWITPEVTIIAGGNIEIEHDVSFGPRTTLYASNIYFYDHWSTWNETFHAYPMTILSPGLVSISDHIHLSGLIYCGNLYGGEDSEFRGSCLHTGTYTDSPAPRGFPYSDVYFKITYDSTKLPAIAPTGMYDTIIRLKGSWKEL